MSDRIYNQTVDVDYKGVAEFFEKRGENKELAHRYNYVLYQDEHPELAVKRDRQEKEKISKSLSFHKGERVLDIGCGIGRWGEYLLEKGLYYVGIDASIHMIDIATVNLKKYKNKKLIIGTFQELEEKLIQNEETLGFDKIFVNGVFMYLNEADFYKALDDVKHQCNERAELYLKESMGVQGRLTLQDIYSESLTQNYSAIYRSIKEYRDAFQSCFGDSFTLLEEGKLFTEDLENRRDTIDYYFTYRR